MTQRIVVGIDDSRGGRRALAWALDQAVATHQPVTVVHAYTGSVSWIDVSSTEVDKMRHADAKRALDVAEHVVADVRDGTHSEVDVEITAVVGEPTRVLVAAANEHTDLLVIGSRGRGGFAGALLGSVSQRVAQHSPVPVVIVPDHEVD